MVVVPAVLVTASKASVNTAAVAVPTADERTIAVAGDKTENYSTAEGRSATSWEMVPEVVKKQQESDKEAAPAVCGMAVDTNGKMELAVK